MAGMTAEFDAMFHLAFRAIQLLGRLEAKVASEAEQQLLRAVIPLAKLTTGKQAVEVVSEAVECFGGQGYMEDTGLGGILRDSHVLPLWEGTTNVLSLDVLKTLGKDGVLPALAAEIGRLTRAAKDAQLKPLVEAIDSSANHVATWASTAMADPVRAQAGARRVALTLGRTLELGLMVEHAQWCLDNKRGRRALAAARRFAQGGIDLIDELDADDARLLVGASAVRA